MKEVCLVASKNARDYTRDEMAGAGVRLERWFRASRLVHGYHVLCMQDKTALRFILPAQCAWDAMQVPDDAAIEDTPAMKRFERHLATGLMSVPREAVPVPEDLGGGPDWAKGALLIEYHVLLNQHAQVRAETLRYLVRVYPECSGCAHVFADPEEPRKVCGGCNIHFYCGPECQTQHWPQHRPFCQFLQSQSQLQNQKKK
jgi:hypothetical protein